MDFIIFDIETDGLDLSEISTIHTISLYDSRDGKIHTYDLEDVKHGIKHLSEVDMIVGHNIIDYDIPVIQKFHSFKKSEKVIDTLIFARLVYPDLWLVDPKLVKQGRLEKRLQGRHSLEAYGQRLGLHKGDYGKDTDWKHWSKEMSDYCRLDVKVTLKLFKKLSNKPYDKEALRLEHNIMTIIKRQMDNGCGFDVDKAKKLYSELVAKSNKLEVDLIDTFGSWIEPKGDPYTAKRDNSRYGYVEGATYQKIDYVTFNPNSRVHIYKRLMEKYDWKPTEYTDGGQPKVSESVLKELPFPEAEMLVESLTLGKRLGQLADGRNGWLKLVKDDNRIYGYVNTNGTVTGRMTHSSPNMAQVPSTGSPYGAECRELFVPRKDWKLVGADASGLELRCLAHYMAKYDDGRYTKILLEEDIHTANQHSAGLDERSDAKRFIYAFLYGAGDELLGEITAPEGATTREKRKHGKKLRSKFLEKTKGIRQLQDTVQNVAKFRGHLIGLDGRKLPVRAIYSALNVLLQSAGAVIMKKALVLMDRNIQELGYKPQVDYEFMINVHDEVQIECRPEIADIIGQQAVKGIQQAGEHFDFRCPLDGEYDVGDSWKDTH